MMDSRENVEEILRHVESGVVISDETGNAKYLNTAAENLTGWKSQDALGVPINQIVRFFHETTCEPLEDSLVTAMRENRTIASGRPALLIRRDGNEAYVKSISIPLRKGDTLAGGVIVLNDVSESRELNRRLHYHASHDILTGLVNRHEFQTLVERSLKKVKDSGEYAAVCHLDIDQFRTVNKSLGLSAGDAVLGQCGAVLKSHIRQRDALARLSGNAFGLLLEGDAIDTAEQTAEMLCNTIRDYEFKWADQPFRLSMSIGVLPIASNFDTADHLLMAAEEACRQAKQDGGNTVRGVSK
jgi:diguanylate cyclase (GGDEF)-like protein/PAS domain S-box-containing protein